MEEEKGREKKIEQLCFFFLSQHRISMQQTGVATEKVIVGGLWEPCLFLHEEWTVFHEQWSEYRKKKDGNNKKCEYPICFFFSQETKLNQLMVCTEENENLYNEQEF